MTKKQASIYDRIKLTDEELSQLEGALTLIIRHGIACGIKQLDDRGEIVRKESLEALALSLLDGLSLDDMVDVAMGDKQYDVYDSVIKIVG